MAQQDIITAFELHAVTGIKACFENGTDPNGDFEGKPLIYQLINMYSRGPLFKECIRVFVDYGLKMDDQVLLAVLLNDANGLDALLEKDLSLLHKKYTFDCTFTPLHQASLLHLCAEYNHVEAAAILIKHGMDANIKAGVDEHGFGGQTAIFHTVNQHANCCMDMLRYLLRLKADLTLTVKGLIWGKGYEWETYIPAVNPVSYAMMGLLRQFQRTEKDIYEVVSVLMKEAYGVQYVPENVPNKYLIKK